MAAPGHKKPKVKLTRKSKLKRFFWCWGLALGLAMLLSLISSIYVNFTDFRDSAFGARDEKSLLQLGPTPRLTANSLSIGPIFSINLGSNSTPASSTSTPEAKATSTPPPVTTPPSETTSAVILAPTPTIVSVPTPTVAPTPTPIPDAPTVVPSAANTIVEKIQHGERISLLILGYDGPGFNGPYLTDTILEIVYDPAKKMVNMINIPRDLYVFIPYGENNEGKWGKINQAFSYVMNSNDPGSVAGRYRFAPNNITSKTDAAAILAKDTVEQFTGIPVDYWMTVNFAGFRSLIDAIGGVTVTVEKAFDDHDYSTNPGVNDGRNYLHFDAGVQKMNGLRALNYARSRNSTQDNGDLGRATRNQLLTISEKLKEVRPTTVRFRFAPTSLMAKSVASGRAA